MTKTKSQLRAEAVERLKDYEGWHKRVEAYERDPDLLMAVIGTDNWGMTWQENRDVLIDLLTDDTHEARGSYEERLYDVPVSECPYCGCERVVIHDFNDIYEKPHSYRVEHIDEKEAFNAGCFESYYAFDSVEKAVEHANMRDLLTDDEPETITRDGIEEIMRNLAAEVTNDGVEIHGAIPIEDAMKSAMQCVDDLLTDDETDVSESIQNGEKDKFDTRDDTEFIQIAEKDKFEFDTREKLEEDVREWCESSGAVFPQARANTVVEWLDRQAEITKQKCSELNEVGCAPCKESQKRAIGLLQAKIAELKDHVSTLCESVEVSDKVIAEQLKRLAEQDRSIVEYAEKVDELEAENAALREKLSKALDHAHAIWKLGEI